MCHELAVIPNSIFYFLCAFDWWLANEVWQAGCPHCHSKLHQAAYPRKPRGIPNEQREAFSWRYSFCCSQCRRRTTPYSVRF